MACKKAYCGLCILSTSLDPADVSAKLDLQPTRSLGKDPSSRYRSRREHGSWVRSTEDDLDSTDYREHLQSLFDDLQGKEQALQELRDKGCEMRISCFMSATNNLEIWLDQQAMRTLASLGLEIWWDVYNADDETSNESNESELAGQIPVP